MTDKISIEAALDQEADGDVRGVREAAQQTPSAEDTGRPDELFSHCESDAPLIELLSMRINELERDLAKRDVQQMQIAGLLVQISAITGNQPQTEEKP